MKSAWYAPERKKMSLPVVNAVASTARLRWSAVASVWTRTSVKSSPQGRLEVGPGGRVELVPAAARGLDCPPDRLVDRAPLRGETGDGAAN